MMINPDVHMPERIDIPKSKVETTLDNAHKYLSEQMSINGFLTIRDFMDAFAINSLRDIQNDMFLYCGDEKKYEKVMINKLIELQLNLDVLDPKSYEYKITRDKLRDTNLALREIYTNKSIKEE